MPSRCPKNGSRLSSSIGSTAGKMSVSANGSHLWDWIWSFGFSSLGIAISVVFIFVFPLQAISLDLDLTLSASGKLVSMILPAFRHFRFSFLLVYGEDSVRQLLFIAKPQWVGAYLGDFMGEESLGTATVGRVTPLHDPAASGWMDQLALTHGGLESLRNDFTVLASIPTFQSSP